MKDGLGGNLHGVWTGGKRGCYEMHKHLLKPGMTPHLMLLMVPVPLLCTANVYIELKD